MKTSLLLKAVCACTCVLLLSPKARAQNTPLPPASESFKADFLQQGYQAKLITTWSKDNELAWEPQWSNLFTAPVEGQNVRLVPLLPILQSKSTHNPVKFKLVGVRRYLLIAGEGSAASYQFLILTYDDKKNLVLESDAKFLAAFDGTMLRQTIGSNHIASGTYEKGKRQVVVDSLKLGKAKLPSAARTSGVICEDIYTCYWSGYCSLDGVTYGTMTSDKVGCSAPFMHVGMCYGVPWQLTESSSYQDCSYSNADVMPDWGPGPIPTDRPCPGDPLVAMNIAPSNDVGPYGNIRGGTFGSDVRTTKDKAGIYHKTGHEGVDIEAVPGTPVYAGIAGVVVGVETNFAPGKYKKRSYGNYVYIHNVDGTYSKYNHLDGVTSGLANGDEINRGARIGTSGTTGNAADPGVTHKHLHLQMFNSAGRPIDPMPYLGTPMDRKTGKGRRPC